MADSAPKDPVSKDVASTAEPAKEVAGQKKAEPLAEQVKAAESHTTSTPALVNGVETQAGPKETAPEPPKVEEKKAEPVPSAPSATAVADPPPSVPSPADAPAASAAPALEEIAEAVPDPDEDDLDDLDDVLDEFAATKLDSDPTPPSTSGPGRPLDGIAAIAPEPAGAGAAAGGLPNPAAGLDPFGLPATGGFDDEEFAAQLQAGMADLLGELESSPEMQRQFEDMLRELGAAAGGAAPGAPLAGPGPAGLGGFGGAAGAAAGARGADAGDAAGGPPLSFQESIRRTMERMQESGDAAGAAAASSSQSEADFMAAMMRQMEAGGEGSEEDFSKMLMGMMEQLTNKDILYEPMKELDTKFPEWMEKNKATTPEADLQRYETQQRLVKEIVQRFEEPGYTDDNVESRQYIVDRMQQMQSAGSPPSDLVGDMDAAQEALGELDSGCPTQ